MERLENAEQRIERINAERARKLSKKYAQRVARLKGVLQWELSEVFPEARWQHQKQLSKLKVAYADANEQYQRLKKLQGNTQIIAEQRARVDAMALSAKADYARTKTLVDSLTRRLTEFLQVNMALRMQELSEQQVATRLAIIRIQDLAQPGRGR
jgi:negative regulator of sigma E activity